MAKTYKNPPIVEVICDIRLHYTEKWDWGITQQFYKQVRKELPSRRDVNRVRVGVEHEGSNINQKFSTTRERIQFANSSQTRFVQVGPDGIIINILRGYTSWEDYKSYLLKWFMAYTKVASVSEIVGISLRYINRIELHGSNKSLQHYLAYLPPHLEGMPELVSNIIMRTDYVFQELNGALAITVATEEETDIPAFLLDLEFRSSKDIVLLSTHLEEWIEEAHTCIKQGFEASIKDALREKFDEETS